MLKKIIKDTRGNMILNTILAVLVLVAIGLGAWRIEQNRANNKVQLDTVPSSSVTSAPPSYNTSSTPATISSSNSNSALNSDLSSLQSSFNSQSSDQNAVNSSLNDSSSEISIPTTN